MDTNFLFSNALLFEKKQLSKALYSSAKYLGKVDSHINFQDNQYLN